jgi:hypothetical protein
MQQFTLWLESEMYKGDWDIYNECSNVIVDLPDGRHYGIDVWTYKFLETIIALDKKQGECLNGLYTEPPDLFVKELTRDCIEQTIAHLLERGNLEDVLNPSVIGERWDIISDEDE